MSEISLIRVVFPMVSLKRLSLRTAPCLVTMTMIYVIFVDDVTETRRRQTAYGDATDVNQTGLSRVTEAMYTNRTGWALQRQMASLQAASNQSMKMAKFPVIFYNRVPKCGSSGLLDVIHQMALIHNFTFVRSTLYMHFWLDAVEEEHLFHRMESFHPPWIYERHVHYIDFNRHTTDVSPVYINVIREPIDRLVSWYYYRRYQKGHIRKMPLEKRIRSYDECVLGNHSECVSPKGDSAEEGYFKIIPFFCGQEEFCSYPTQRALQRAVKNVKRNYLAVGTTEYLQQFIQILEAKLPGYFTGAAVLYQNMEAALKEKYHTQYRLPVSKEVVQIMKPKLKLEYQFYYFIRNHFKRQYEEIYNTPLHLL